MNNKLSKILIGLVMLCITSCANRQPATEQESIKEEKSLGALGQLWGFLKYHHPAVANGDYDWDMELMKRIPLVREAENDSIWKKLLDDWLDSLPPVMENPNKKLPDLEIKVKPDYGELFNDEYFFPETIEKIRYILDNAVITTNHYVNMDREGQLSFTNEEPYADLLNPPEVSYRLLALFRFWNMINYFYPYRELCDQKWTEVLVEMIPEFVNVQDVEQYIFTCLKLVTKLVELIDISHLNLWGALTAPFETQFIENKLTVTVFTGNDPNVIEKIETGDVITSIDGEDVGDIVKRMLPYIPAPNDAVKLRNISSMILNGNSNTVSLVFQRDGKVFDVKIPRYDKRLLVVPDYLNPHPEKEGYMVLENNIGYVLPSNCKVEERDTGIKKVLNGTKGVILDLRCKPNDDIYPSFAANLRLEQAPFYHNRQESRANISYPGYFFVSKKFQKNKDFKYRYTPKIVVIVNEFTQGLSEGLAIDFQSFPNTVVIGSTTAAATDGNKVYYQLPGKIDGMFTAAGKYYLDGSNFQRVGVKIDEIVKPTIAGIKAGRDELLERAIEIITNEETRVNR